MVLHELLLDQPGDVFDDAWRSANYLIGFTDGTGAPLQGEKSYALNLPPKIPVANFWSLTLYDAANGSGLDNGQPFPSLGSRDRPQQEQDGSTVLYLGPRAPEGKVSNWLRTVPGKDYFVILRLYGPLQAAIDHTWKPGDVEPAAAGQVIGMVLHELATNAAKYGALSNKDGRVWVCWRRLPNVRGENQLHLEWQERGGPLVIPQSRWGYGSRVIRELIPHELGGTVELVHSREGVRCNLEIPARWITDSKPRSQ